MTALQIAAILQLLVAFGVPSATVQNVDSILTNSVATLTAPVQTPVPSTPAPVATTQTAPVQTQPATTPLKQPPVATVVPVTPPVPAPAPVPAPVPTITFMQNTIGDAFITAGPDPLDITTIAVTVTGNLAQGSSVTVSSGEYQFGNMFDEWSFHHIKVWSTVTWYVPRPLEHLAPWATMEIAVNAPGATSAKVAGFIATDMRTGADVSQHVTIGEYHL